jgi:hypothetical protein
VTAFFNLRPTLISLSKADLSSWLSSTGLTGVVRFGNGAGGACGAGGAGGAGGLGGTIAILEPL